jgi:hypothetical protein
LIIVSFLIPISAFSSILFAKAKEKYLLISFGLIALISMFFMAGSHAPLGFIYVFLIEHVPGFIAFRTPFYKFAPGLWFSFAIMIGFICNYFILRYLKKAPYILISLAISALVVGYSFPFLGTKFFNYGPNRTTRVKVPSYVNDYAKWANSNQFPYNRLLTLPAQHPDNHATETTWGYWSLAPINSLLDKRLYIDRTVPLLPGESAIINEFYDAFDAQDPKWKVLADKLGIDGIILRDDIVPYEYHNQTISPAFYHKIIDNQFTKTKDFGPWHIYSLKNIHSSFYTAKGYIQVENYNTNKSLSLLDDPTGHADNRTVVIEKDLPSMDSLKIANIYIPECANCEISSKFLGPENHNVGIIPGSKIYKLKQLFEQIPRFSKRTIQDKVNYEVSTATKRLYEYDVSFNSGAGDESRSISLDLYKQQLDKLASLLQQYNKEHVLSNETNTFYIPIYNTLDYHRTIIQNYVDNGYEITNEKKIQDIYDVIDQLITIINSNSYFSINRTDKRYYVNIKEPGDYELYLKKNTANLFSGDALTASVDGKMVDLAPEEKNNWISLLQYSFTKGKHFIELQEKTAENIITNDYLLTKKGIVENEEGELTMDFTQNECVDIPLSQLTQEKYHFNVRFNTENAPTRIWAFLGNNHSILPRLKPENGQVINLPKNKPLNINLDIQVDDNKDLVYKICQFSNKHRIPITITNISAQRISTPLVELVKLNALYKEPELRPIEATKKDNTSYQLSLSSGSAQLLVFTQRFDSHWKIDKYPNAPHAKGDLYANVWYIPQSSSNNKLDLSYTPQHIFNISKWIATIATILVLFILWKLRNEK